MRDDEFFLPRTDLKELSETLKRIPWILRELDNTIARRTVISANRNPDTKATGTAEQPDYFNEHASNIKHHLQHTLAHWVEEICINTHIPWPHSEDHHAFWLDTHIIDLAKLPDAHRAHRDIRTASTRAHTAIDRPEPPEFVGPCQSPDTSTTCDGMYARRGTETKNCRACGITCNVTKMQSDMLREVSARLYPAAELASAMSLVTNRKVEFERIRTWIRRSKLTPATNHGEPLYRMTDALELLNRRRKANAA